MITPPVLFILFNRPEATSSVFEAIRLAQPDRLYVAADGPRSHVKSDTRLCKETRSIVENVDWNCEVHTLFQDENLGCGDAVSGAITWFFEHEEAGIILEDDCLPNSSFFRYCEELLDRYRDDDRIFTISGNNFQAGKNSSPYSYYFSHYNHVWGWASWRRAWKYYDHEMKSWDEFRLTNGLDSVSPGNSLFRQYWTRIFNDTSKKLIDTWDFRWTLSIWCQSGLTCIPEKNLVSNIGFDEKATHTRDQESILAQVPNNELNFPLKHPQMIYRNTEADRYTDKVYFGISFVQLPVNNFKRFAVKVLRKLKLKAEH